MGFWRDNDEWRLMKSAKDQADTIDIVISAFRSMNMPGAYISMPITTGERYYDVLDDTGLDDLASLSSADNDLLYDEIIRPNMDEGISFAEGLQKKLDLPVIAPSLFEARKQRWSKDEYMFLWMRVLEEKVTKLFLKPGWEYSNGSCAEYVHLFEMQCGFINPERGMDHIPSRADKERLFEQMRNAKVYVLNDFEDVDKGWMELRVDYAALLMQNAVNQLNRRNRRFKPFQLLTSLDNLASITDYFSNPDPQEKDRYVERPYDLYDPTVQTALRQAIRHNKEFGREYLQNILKMPEQCFDNRYSLSPAIVHYSR